MSARPRARTLSPTYLARGIEPAIECIETGQALTEPLLTATTISTSTSDSPVRRLVTIALLTTVCFSFLSFILYAICGTGAWVTDPPPPATLMAVSPPLALALVNDTTFITVTPIIETPIQRQWATLHSLLNTSGNSWCHYPQYPSAFTFDESRYRSQYMPNNMTCESLDTDRRTKRGELMSLPFSASVDPSGWLTVSGCDNGTVRYSVRHGGAHPTAMNRRVLLQFPATFVYVWCRWPRGSLAMIATDYTPAPLFLAVHTPVPASRQALPGLANTTGGWQCPTSTTIQLDHRKNLFVLQLDALSLHKLPVIMPRTYALLESLRQGQSRSPSEMLAFRYDKLGLAGGNSSPFFRALTGHTADEEQSPDHPSWLWVAAKQQGYVTGIGETACTDATRIKYQASSIAIDSNNASHWIDHNFVAPFCGPSDGYDPFSARVPRCLRGKDLWRYVLDGVDLSIQYHSQSNSTSPLLYLLDLVEPHEETGFVARHMDDSFADSLKRLINSEAMKNGVLLVLSDHGLHYGKYQQSSSYGQQEHTQPFFYLVASNKALGPKSMAAAWSNQNKLVTGFDMHSMLMSAILGCQDGHAAVLSALSKPLMDTVSPVGRTQSLLQWPALSSSRVCEQTNMELPIQWNIWRAQSKYCMCQSPFTLTCPKPATVTPSGWQECTQLWSHPLLFDATYYVNTHLGSTGTAGPCDALLHWCTSGMYTGLQSKPRFHLAAMIDHHPRRFALSTDASAYARWYLEDGHRNSPPLSTLASAPIATTISELHEVCDGRTQQSKFWLRAISAGQICQADSDTALVSHDSHTTLLWSALRQCHNWCLFDLRSSSLDGWALTPTGCLIPFKSSHTNNTCIQSWSHLKDLALER